MDFLARDGVRYQRLLTSLDASLASAAKNLARRLPALPPGFSVAEFDLISGLTGVGTALLSPRERPEAGEALASVLNTLVRLVQNEDAAIPRWYTPSEQISDAGLARTFPDGCLNCGLAHGIPGPLALMALARLEGMQVVGLCESIRHVANWLVEQRVDDQWGLNWPFAVGLDPDHVKAPSRTAWCYGAPGIARALWLAGKALGNDALSAIALDSMEAVYRRPLSARDINSPTFCHGIAGLLQVTLRFAHDTRLPVFRDAAATLTDQLLAAHDTTQLLGYRALEAGDNPVDHPGLLEGASGVALVLPASGRDQRRTAVGPAVPPVLTHPWRRTH